MRASQRKPRLAGRGLGETWRGVNPHSHYTTQSLQIRRSPVVVYVRRASTKFWPSTVRAS